MSVRMFAACVIVGAASWAAAQPEGFYRQPALHGETIVFVSEGDLWRVAASGGVAQRLTTHPSVEDNPLISPDGATLYFTGRYEGPGELYAMPLSGGAPTRLTYDGSNAAAWGVSGSGQVLFSTGRYATLPNAQLHLLDAAGGSRTAVPLAQAADGSFAADGTLYFTRLPFQGSHTRGYVGGTAQNVWRFGPGEGEAVALTADYTGTSKRPIVWNGRVYFLSDRGGAMNVWSMGPGGDGLTRHTAHREFEVQSFSVQNGRAAYHLGADIRLLDLASGEDRVVPITLATDLDQEREKWIDRPMSWVTSAEPSPDGGRVVLVARGQVFVAPHRQGRLVQAARVPSRFRAAKFSHDGAHVLALGDASGEVEVWKIPANGVGEPQQLTSDGDVLRWDLVPSPDGRFIAHHDKNQRLFLMDTTANTNSKIDESPVDSFAGLTWSADGRYLAYVETGANLLTRIKVYDTRTNTSAHLTSDRYDSASPAFSPDGKWLYFLSDRHLVTSVSSPWGSHQPDPFLDKKTRIYALALTKGLRSPFVPRDEVHDAQLKAEKEKPKETTPKETTPPAPPAIQPGTPPADPVKEPEKSPAGGASPAAAGASSPEKPAEKPVEKPKVPSVEIDFDGIMERLIEVPAPNGNYAGLAVTEKALFFLSGGPAGDAGKRALVAFPITNENPEVKTVVDADVASFTLTQDRAKILVRKGDVLSIIDAAASKADLDKKDVNLAGWRLSVIPREEWRQMFTESWRLMRDYFYDPAMHGVDWKALHRRFLPLVDRVRSREELAAVMAQMVAELAALHHFVRPGDVRQGPDSIASASLGCVLEYSPGDRGWRITRIYRHDPDEPQRAAPVAVPTVGAREGDLILSIDGVEAGPGLDPHRLLRNKAGRQVLLRIRPAGGEPERDAVAVPISMGAEADLRYHEWQWTRRELVREWSGGRIAYVHLRAMGGENFTEFVKGYYPDFNKDGLIVDVRHNRGGNIDSWLLSKLSRKAWFYWSQRRGRAPLWNMQFAFRGHMACLVNEMTASDGEAFAEGFRRLGLGPVIGTRTWGGEIWLSSSNVLVDRGIASASEFGVYGPEGEWLIEGHGVDPDVIVDNPPHATFNGEDAQLKAAVDALLKKIAEEPIPDLPPPPHPVKAITPRP
ncbi:MAG: PD40 domain-containing protein [Phycisphaeraceae bacterium]|nr:MAG: PD40 domain-containing protein [Phycisphaeraceae bacterium]